MDSFFNTAFYYFRKWPYDKYNVAFLEAKLRGVLNWKTFHGRKVVEKAKEAELYSKNTVETDIFIGLNTQWELIRKAK